MIKKKRYNAPMAKFHKLKITSIVCNTGTIHDGGRVGFNPDASDDPINGEEQW